MRRIVVERAAIKQNLKVVRAHAGDAVIYASLSGDGGGLGTVNLARILRDEGIVRFALGELSQAERLRKAGFWDEELLMLPSTTQREALERLVDLNVVCSISSVDSGIALNEVCAHRATVAEAHIQIDTGMGFGGFLTGEPEKILLAYRSLPCVALSGVYTQLHSGPDARAQLAAFHQVLEFLHAAGYETGVVHAAGSFALLHRQQARLDAVRAGSILLGRCARYPGDGLQRVGRGEAEISELRWLPKGHRVGAAEPMRLRRDTRVAVLPVGYLHGLWVRRPRSGSLWQVLRAWYENRRGGVTIQGRSARILGCIGASQTLVDVTGLKCAVGDTAVFEIDPLYARDFAVSFQ